MSTSATVASTTPSEHASGRGSRRTRWVAATTSTRRPPRIHAAPAASTSRRGVSPTSTWTRGCSPAAPRTPRQPTRTAARTRAAAAARGRGPAARRGRSCPARPARPAQAPWRGREAVGASPHRGPAPGPRARQAGHRAGRDGRAGHGGQRRAGQRGHGRQRGRRRPARCSPRIAIEQRERQCGRRQPGVGAAHPPRTGRQQGARREHGAVTRTALMPGSSPRSSAWTSSPRSSAAARCDGRWPAGPAGRGVPERAGPRWERCTAARSGGRGVGHTDLRRSGRFWSAPSVGQTDERGAA